MKGKEPRIHYHASGYGTPTPCGITPSYRRPTRTVREWYDVDCAECLATTRSSQIRTAPIPPSRINFRTNHPRWPETLAAVRAFMERYGRERAKALVGKYVRPFDAAVRVSNVPTAYWSQMRSEAEYWMAKPVEPASREAAWGDLYFWRRDRPNKSWHWVQGRETSQSREHGEKFQPWHPDRTGFWRSCPPSYWKYYGTRTGRWSGKHPNLAAGYSGKLSENLIQGSIYAQMAPRITGNTASHIIVDDPISKRTATDVMRQMDKAWRVATMYGDGKPDLIHCGDAFLKAYRKGIESASVLESLLNFNYKEIEARVNAAFTDALLYGSAGYTIAAEDLKQPPIVKENAVSLQNLQNLSKNFGFNPAEFVPARHGQPWDYESDARLIRYLKGGFSIVEIAQELQRSEVSIECRITFLAYKDERAALLQAGIAKLTAEPKTPRKAAKRKKAKDRK